MQIESRRREVAWLSRQSADDDSDHMSRSQSAAQHFEHICELVNTWWSELHVALIHCQDFHLTIDNLHDWITRIDAGLKAVELINTHASQSELRRKHSVLKVFVKQHVQHVVYCTVWFFNI